MSHPPAIVVAVIALLPLLSHGQPTLDKPSTSTAVSLAELQRCLGKSIDSDEVARLIKQFPRSELPAETRLAWHVADLAAGIDLRFFGTPRRLEAIHLHVAPKDSFTAYQGELPAGLSRDDTRRAVEANLGPPSRSTTLTGYAAIYESRGLYVEYVDDAGREPNNRLSLVTLTVPRDVPATAMPPHKLTVPRIAFRLVDDGSADGHAEVFADPSDPAGKSTLRLARTVLLDETDVDRVERVQAPTRQDREGQIGLTMTTPGSQRLREITRANIGRRLAVVLDGRVLIAPNIRDEIGRSVIISLPDSDPRQFGDIFTRLHAAVNVLPEESSTTQPATTRP